MTDELKKAFLENNIQIIRVYDGKFVLLNTTEPMGNVPLVFKELFSREIPVGSIFIINVDVGDDEVTDIRTSVFVCCNASQSFINKKMVKNNLFWYEITHNNQVIVPNEVIV